MTMYAGNSKIVSIQVGKIAPLGPDEVPSGFNKTPIIGGVRAETLGLEGDAQADLSVHGGPDKAVYFYPWEHYATWQAETPRHTAQLKPGAFGENITSDVLNETTVCIGDVLRIGTAEFQVTQPRQPCFKLGLRFEDNTLGRIMVKSGRTGWYVRVTKKGSISSGDAILLERRPNPEWSVLRFHRATVEREADIQDLKELLTVEGVAQAWIDSIREALRE